MELLKLAVIRCGQWMGNRNIIWSGLTKIELKIDAGGGQWRETRN